MKTKQFTISLVFLFLIFSIFCKKGSPTSPEIIDLSGIITLNGQPFPDADVYLSWGASQKTTTGVNGEFSFTDIPSGDLIITPSLVGYVFSPSNYEVGYESRDDLDFTAQLATYGAGPGDITADFNAVDQDGLTVSLYDYFGKVILLTFSADWCGPCREEAGHLQALYNQYEDKGFQAITLLLSGSPSAWADQYSLTFPVLNDNNQLIWSIYGEGYVPLNIVLDRNCTIRYKEAGYSEDSIEATIEKYL